MSDKPRDPTKAWLAAWDNEDRPFDPRAVRKIARDEKHHATVITLEDDDGVRASYWITVPLLDVITEIARAKAALDAENAPVPDGCIRLHRSSNGEPVDLPAETLTILDTGIIFDHANPDPEMFCVLEGSSKIRALIAKARER